MKALWSRPRPERFAEAERLVSLDVVVRSNPFRDGSSLEELRGRLVSVARIDLGTGTDVVVIRRRGHVDFGVSLAQVHSIELA